MSPQAHSARTEGGILHAKMRYQTAGAHESRGEMDRGMRDTQNASTADVTISPSTASDNANEVAFGWRWADGLLDWAARHPRIPLAIALAVGVLARVVLVVRSNALIDGDEAMVGIQAEHILRGDFPTYFSGQVYMGSLETYLIAGTLPAVWPLAVGDARRAHSARAVAGLSHLAISLRAAAHGSRATPLLAGLAALFAAAPPLYDAVTELRTWGGQIEVYVIILALLLATVELAQRLRAGAGVAELARRWAVWGFLAGLGIWVNPLIVYGLITAVALAGVPVSATRFPRPAGVAAARCRSRRYLAQRPPCNGQARPRYLR